jgi:hypothetical protein
MDRKIHSEEFKRKALRPVGESGMTLSRVVREVGVKQKTLHRWKSQIERAVASGPDHLDDKEPRACLGALPVGSTLSFYPVAGATPVSPGAPHSRLRIHFLNANRIARAALTPLRSGEWPSRSCTPPFRT